MRQLSSRALLVAALACMPAIASAANYDEAVNGDLSGVPASPTPWVLGEGSNTLKGAAGGSDYDIVTFTVPAGFQLSSLVLDAYSNLGYQSFSGLQSGSTWTTGVGNAIDGGTLLGYVLYDTGLIGTDLLDNIAEGGAGFGNGFTPPLPAGAYTFLSQDTVTPFSYQFNFNVTAVPEPATIGLAALGLLAITRIRRR